MKTNQDTRLKDFNNHKKKYSAKSFREPLYKFVLSLQPNTTKETYFSEDEVQEFRKQYIANYLSTQLGELSGSEKEVVNSLSENTVLTGKLDDEDDEKILTLGEKLADKVADFGGSWKFIILFSVLIMVWVVINVYILGNKGFDPYPFILLNLFLSCIAAIQAPVIMMSQNRQEDKDRERAKKDYMINLKSEVEIHTLHEKLDHLIIQQQEELLNIQQQQIEKLNLIIEKFDMQK
ncbi:MAG: DUF1003 domain-containing protein [Bacteroidetes bacterium]|jgi:uncharacterized membrane protein|nr:DUF1003 domain-containing protein [Bacteroidota bacterium]